MDGWMDGDRFEFGIWFGLVWFGLVLMFVRDHGHACGSRRSN